MDTAARESARVPKNYLLYHFTYALPTFVKSRPKKLVEEFGFLNIANLAKNLFAPYRRLIMGKKSSLLDRLSFNLVSIGIGATVRTLLIIFGLFMLLTFAFVYFIQIVLFIPPIASLPDYILFKRYTFFDFDIADNKKFIHKLERSDFYKNLFFFFDENFKRLFENLPQPNTLGVKTNQNLAEMFLSLSQNWPNLKTYLASQNISPQEFATLIQYLNAYFEHPIKVKPFPLGHQLVYGYTRSLEVYCRELTNQKMTSPYFNKAVVENIEKIITRVQANNALLIGEVGVGKHSGIVDLATAITRRQLPNLNEKRVLVMDTIALISSSKNLVDIKYNFETLLLEAKHAGNIILVIDFIEKISSTEAGHIDLSEVLNTVLTDNSLPIIGITSYDDYNKYIRTNPSFVKFFERVEVAEPQKETVLQILIGKTLEIHQKNRIAATYQSLLEIVDKSSKLITDKFQPEKSILLLEDGVARAERLNKNQVTLDIVDQVLTERTKIPVGKITTDEIEKLKDLEGFLHKRIVGQDEAVAEIAKAMRRSRTGLEKGSRPMGSFLFLGPTGVGKTETAKALADAFFGSASKMIRLDMTEFKEDGSIKRLIGDKDTNAQGQLTSLVRQNPYGLLLVDEFEKANSYVQNLFLQILDEGNLTDAFGKKVGFSNIIIIATTNAGAEFIREEVAKGTTTDLSAKLIEYVLAKGLFNPELINRFDATVVYQPLTQKQIVEVAKLMLNEFAAQIKDTKNILIEVNDTLAAKVAEKGYDVQFGARPIRRLIQDKIEDGIAKMIINGDVANGQTINAETLLSFL